MFCGVFLEFVAFSLGFVYIFHTIKTPCHIKTDCVSCHWFFFSVWPLQGLLQSEAEGVDNENIGFYGKCVLHATYPMCESGHVPETGCIEKQELTCARTEVFDLTLWYCICEGATQLPSE